MYPEDDERADQQEHGDHPWQPALGVVEPVAAGIEGVVELPHRIVEERLGPCRARIDRQERRVDVVHGRPGTRTVVAVLHARPLLVDDDPDVRTDGAANRVTLCLRERFAVPHDRCESVRLAAHAALRVAVVLVRDHDDEGEQQAEERRHDAEHLRRNLGVEPLATDGTSLRTSQTSARTRPTIATTTAVRRSHIGTASTVPRSTRATVLGLRPGRDDGPGYGRSVL